MDIFINTVQGSLRIETYDDQSIQFVEENIKNTNDLEYCSFSEQLFFSRAPNLKAQSDLMNRKKNTRDLNFGESLENTFELRKMNEIRTYPDFFNWNVQVDSLTHQTNELNLFKQSQGMLIADVTPVTEGRDPLALHRLSVSTNVKIVMGTTPDTVIQKECEDSEMVEAVLTTMERDLILGVKIGHLGIHDEFSDPDYRIRAAFLGMFDVPAQNFISEQDIAYPIALVAAAKASMNTGAPCFIRLPYFCCGGQKLLEFLVSHGMDPKKVVFAGMNASQPIEYHLGLLASGCNLCFDTFGNIQYFEGPDQLPNDEVNCSRILDLIKNQQDCVNQILLSNGIRFRMQLQSYGGFGYSHVLVSVISRLKRLGLDQVGMNRILRDNMLQLLSWYTPPEIEKEPEEIGTCSWCQKSFAVKQGEYFTKFEFVYCRSKCLTAHGKLNWADPSKS